MGNELLLQQQNQVNPLQTQKEPTIPDIETEIECPRCHDVMVLSSDFDRLCYFCQECNLSLLIN
jgi:late competence protein required for DNA uptake (superfamily II DNA/RNA helicase)